MSVPAQLEEAILNDLMVVIQKKFALDAASEINFKSIQIDPDEQKIVIELSITTSARPEAVAKGYVGLTGKVREVLGSDWSEFFPVITPQIHSGVHA